MSDGQVVFTATEVSAVFSLAGLTIAGGVCNAIAIASRSPGPVYLNFANVPGGIYPTTPGPVIAGVQQFPAGSLVARPDLPGCVLVPAGGVVTISGGDMARLGAATMVAAWAPMRGRVIIQATNVPFSTSGLLDI